MGGRGSRLSAGVLKRSGVTGWETSNTDSTICTHNHTRIYIYIYIYIIYIYISIYLSIYLSLSLSLYLSIYLSIGATYVPELLRFGLPE